MIRIRKTDSERGVALIGSLIVATMLIGAAGLYLFVSYGGFETSNRELAGMRARLAAEEGLHRAMAELKLGVDTGGDGLGNITFAGPDERQIQAGATALGGNLYRLHSRGQVPRAALACDTLIELLPSESLAFPLRGAITAEGPVSTLGNINIDGRDWNENGTSVVGPGVFGISSMQTITNGGSSTVGGNGFAPSRPPNPAALEPLSNWNDGVDNDGDGLQGEEAFDGADNDGDGEIDEDTNDYPDTPDILFHLAPGTLKNAAIATGTYFSSATALDAYYAANGNDLPGGKIFYCDFDVWEPVQFGNAMNEEPSIIIHHNPSGTAVMKNLHGAFKGVVLSDFVQHINGDFLLVGGLMSFADDSVGNAFGNGGANILYSSTVLNDLPAAGSTSRVRVLSWSRSSANQ